MKREIWLDYLRVTACFLVMIVHGTEPFYLGGDGAQILTATDAFWVALAEAVARFCVPIFLLASSYLQFPLHYSTGEFLRRRAVRILIPLAVWTLVYALVWGEPVKNLQGLLLNFNYAAGHLWFVYMLVGVYLIMPMLSPWAQKVSRKELSIYLAIWLITTFFPLVRQLAGGVAPLIQAADGLPAPAQFPLWGEASWNPYGTFYYISGFIGYLLWGLYIRRFIHNTRRTAAFGWMMFFLGVGSIFGGMLMEFAHTETSPDGFLQGGLDLAVAWEVPLAFCGFPVFLSALGITLVFRRIGAAQDASPFPFQTGPESHSLFYLNLIQPLSKAGYGMYLMHMLVLAQFSAMFRSWLGLGSEGVLGVWTTPVQILATALCSFIVTGLIAVLLQRIPKIGKYLMG